MGYVFVDTYLEELEKSSPSFYGFYFYFLIRLYHKAIHGRCKKIPAKHSAPNFRHFITSILYFPAIFSILIEWDIDARSALGR